MELRIAVDKYINYLESERGLSQKSIREAKSMIKKFLLWLGNVNTEALSVENVRRFRVALSQMTSKSKANFGEKLEASTIERTIYEVRKMLKYLHADNLVAFNPDEIEVKKITHAPRYALNCEEVEKLLDQPRTDSILGLRNKAILELLVSTGLRLSECAGLDRNLIDFDNCEFRVKGKGKKIRIVFLTDRCKKWILKYLEARADKSPALFINHITLKRLNSKTIQRIVYDTAEQAGIHKKVSPHILRHTFATLLVERNVNMAHVQKLLGHSDIRTTMVYSHLNNEAIKREHRRVLDF